MAGRTLVAFRDAGELRIGFDECPHLGASLSEGRVCKGKVVCPWHGWTYRLSDGAHLTSFGERPGIRTYEHRVTDAGEVQVTLEEPVGD